ncbi:MAG: 50S ribosomal protein L16 [Patescibacteria group bacterium]
MLSPKRTKYKKSFRGRMKGVATRGNSLSFGEFGLKASEAAWLAANQLEAARKAVTHELKKGGRVWLRVFPDKPVTARPAARMGGGKGDVVKYVAVIKPGRIIIEIAGVSKEIMYRAFGRAKAKLPFKSRIVEREG